MTRTEIFEAIEKIHPCWVSQEDYASYMAMKLECLEDELDEDDDDGMLAS